MLRSPQKNRHFQIDATLASAAGPRWSVDPDLPGGRLCTVVQTRRQAVRYSYAADQHACARSGCVAPDKARASREARIHHLKSRHAAWLFRRDPVHIRQWQPPFLPLFSDRKSWSVLRAGFLAPCPRDFLLPSCLSSHSPRPLIPGASASGRLNKAFVVGVDIKQTECLPPESLLNQGKLIFVLCDV